MMSETNVRRSFSRSLLFFLPTTLLISVASCDAPDPSGPGAPDILFKGKPSEDPEIFVDDFNPKDGEPGLRFQLTVDGDGFQDGATVFLGRNGKPVSTITTHSTTVQEDLKRLVGDIEIGLDAKIGDYQVVVSFRRGKGIGTESFKVKGDNPEGPNVDVTLMGGIVTEMGGIVTATPTTLVTDNGARVTGFSVGNFRGKLMLQDAADPNLCNVENPSGADDVFERLAAFFGKVIGDDEHADGDVFFNYRIELKKTSGLLTLQWFEPDGRHIRLNVASDNVMDPGGTADQTHVTFMDSRVGVSRSIPGAQERDKLFCPNAGLSVDFLLDRSPSP